MYSNVIQKLWIVKWKAVAGYFLLFLARGGGGFQRVRFRHRRAGLPFVSVCLFMKSHTVQARGGFNRGSVVLSASGRGAGYWSSG